MALCGLLTLVVLMASIGLSFTADVNGESSPADDTKGCLSKEDCNENEYCGGRNPTTKRCIECFDCALVQRKPKIRTYDGPGCAEHKSECGECNEGYRDSSGWCILNEFYTTSTLKSPRYFNMDNNYHRQSEADDKMTKDASTGSIIFGVFLMLTLCLAIGLGVYGVRYKCNERNSPNKQHTTPGDEETAGLYNRSYENASAPPDEYHSPPPPYNHFNPSIIQDCIDNRQPVPPTLAHAQNATALPFTRGNGAGNWMVNSPVEQTGDRSVNDSISHGTSGDVPPRRTEDTADSPGDNVRTPPTDTVNGHHAQVTPRFPQSQNNYLSQGNLNGAIPPASTPRRSFQGPPPVNNETNNPVLGYIDFSFHIRAAQAFFAQRPVPSFSHPPANPHVRMVMSAPSSPRRADDTYVENLLELQEPFAPSNGSLVSGDSGTGSGDHERSVPSRSVSGGDVRGSDMDDSLFDDSDQPESPGTNEQRPVVPDIAQLPDFMQEPMDINQWSHEPEE